MEQILLDWGTKPSTESIPPANSLQPLSWPEVEHVRNLLNQRSQIVSKGNTIPKHLQDTILRGAQYTFRRYLPGTITCSKLQRILQKKPTSEYIQRILQHVTSSLARSISKSRVPNPDNVNVKPYQLYGPYGKSDTFFEVGMYFALTGRTQRIPLVNEKIAITHCQHVNSVTASNGVPTNGYQPAESSNH
ncbi:hypothetical protein B9Z19DRAFT_1069541 [Tuber borchii]|uniref:Uncharacterized protein n=1 Tax=Tuber borchii TaxID=42251 RepID=A0A2T6ZB69_TUBBO|nr:hypothetical protein B9Z19DRAFT_1069541 [Tuber borchii]